MEDITVTSWNELNERLYENSWSEKLGRFRSPLAYRGMQNAEFDLTTSLVRLGGSYDKHEDDLLRNFRKYAFHKADMGDSIWYWLALAQHHGLPTRLLDWSYSPFVALHFATADIELFDRDAVVWCVDYIESNKLLPNSLKALLDRADSNIFTAEMLSEVANNLPDFERLSEDDFVIFLEPPSLDERIVNQYALFSLMSRPSANLDQFLLERPHIYRRLIIPAAVKWEVRDKLDQANITERVLFPGLDGLSRWLKRYYSPRNL
ncbi:MAG: FRG domain-containing protein [Chloroflexota bacterium]